MERMAHRALSPIVALLTLAVLLVGVFAIHSEVTGHDQHTMIPAVSVAAGQAHASLDTESQNAQLMSTGMSSAGPVTGAAATVTAVTATAVMATALTAPVASVMSTRTVNTMLGCTLMAFCALLLIVVTNIVFTRRLAFLRPVRTAGRRVLALVHTVAAPVAGPSLTLLSIRRV